MYESVDTHVQHLDSMGEVFSTNKALLKPLIDGFQQDVSGDKMWWFFLLDVSDATLVRPDEYAYNRNFVHAPYWTAILFTKIGALPPLIGPAQDRPPSGKVQV